MTKINKKKSQIPSQTFTEDHNHNRKRQSENKELSTPDDPHFSSAHEDTQQNGIKGINKRFMKLLCCFICVVNCSKSLKTIMSDTPFHQPLPSSSSPKKKFNFHGVRFQTLINRLLFLLFSMESSCSLGDYIQHFAGKHKICYLSVRRNNL